MSETTNIASRGATLAVDCLGVGLYEAPMISRPHGAVVRERSEPSGAASEERLLVGSAQEV